MRKALEAEGKERRGSHGDRVAASHGVFTPSANEALRDQPIHHVIILNTIPPHRLDPELVEAKVHRRLCDHPTRGEVLEWPSENDGHTDPALRSPIQGGVARVTKTRGRRSSARLRTNWSITHPR